MQREQGNGAMSKAAVIVIHHISTAMPFIQGSNIGMALMNLSQRQSSPGSILIVTLECSFCPLVVLVLLRDHKATQAERRITISTLR